MGDQNVPSIYSGSLVVQIAIPISSGNGTRISALIAAGTLLTAVNLPSWCTTTFGNPTTGATAMTNAQQCQQIAMRTMGIIIENPSAAFSTDFVAAMTNAVSRSANALYQSIQTADAAKRVFLRANAGAFNAIAICLYCVEPITGANAISN